jgi:hypothetical protein
MKGADLKSGTRCWCLCERCFGWNFCMCEEMEIIVSPKSSEHKEEISEEFQIFSSE